MPEVEDVASRSLADLLHQLQHNPFGWPPEVEATRLRAAVEVARTWAAAELGPLDVPRLQHRTIAYQAYRSRPASPSS